MYTATTRGIVVVLLGLIMAACASTRITGHWASDSYDQEISRILVVGMSANTVLQRSYEDALVKHFRDRGIEAVQGSEVLPEGEEITREMIRNSVEGQDFDAILVTRLVGVDKQVSRISTSDFVVPAPFYHNFYDYYFRTYPVVHRRDYLVTDTIVTLETNVYDMDSGKLVWAVTSESFNPARANEVADDLSEIIVEKLAEDGLI